MIGEADRAGTYADANAYAYAYAKKEEREQILRDHDYRLVRWLGKEIMITPQIVVGRIARALEAA